MHCKNFTVKKNQNERPETQNEKPETVLHEDRHPHTYHARQDAQLGAEIRLWRIHSS